MSSNDEVKRLRTWVSDLQSGMFINCVYCGHRYGPKDEVPDSMADVLKRHVEQCPEHPMSKLRAALTRVRALGHNDDCIFCGLKDKVVVETLDIVPNLCHGGMVHPPVPDVDGLPEGAEQDTCWVGNPLVQDDGTPHPDPGKMYVAVKAGWLPMSDLKEGS